METVGFIMFTAKRSVKKLTATPLAARDMNRLNATLTQTGYISRFG